MLVSKCIVLGLTGGIACGKSEAARYLESLGARHIDADAISRAATAPDGAALVPIREMFGDAVFSADGSLDRGALGDIVFKDAEARRVLEGIIHPIVWDSVRRGIEKARSEQIPCTVLNVPLLFESGMDALCDLVWTVEAPKDVQISRIMERGLTRKQAMERISSQLKAEERMARADAVIVTDRPIEETRKELLQRYRELTGI